MTIDRPEGSPLPRPAPWLRGKPPLRAVAVGASTGGPRAVLEILRGLGPDFPVPILLVLHLAKGFDVALADWLNSGSPLRTSLVKDGEALPMRGQGRVLVAPPDCHMILKGGVLRLDKGPERFSCRPSVDVLFESVAMELGEASAACLLTGMGRDGAAGLLALRQARAVTIAQDEASCAVFGMPGEAVRLKAAVQVLPLDRIAPALTVLAHGGR